MDESQGARTWQMQGVRFIVVGLVSNLILYLLYLALTTLGLGHKTAMTLLYAIGVLQTFVFNKHWTFSHHGHISQSLLRYLAAYGSCYVINFISLYIFVDYLGLSHVLVQGIAIIGIAIILFLLQRYWVFTFEMIPTNTAGDTA